MYHHPLTADAIDTLEALRAAALVKLEKAEDRLCQPDSLPRGPEPVRFKIAEHRCTAAHLRIAIEALGGTVAEAPLEALERVVRNASMPERVAA